jgi:transposase
LFLYASNIFIMSPEFDLSHEELIVIILTQRQQIVDLQSANLVLQEEVVSLREEIKKRPAPPAWVKANIPAKDPQPRKKRAKGASRKCVADATPIEHAIDICPDCGNHLTGGWEYSSRESLVFPCESVRIVRHISIARRCGVCGQTVIGRPDPDEHGLVGKHRIDRRGMALISYWHIVCRIPLRVIQRLLQQLYHCMLSLGELRYVLDSIARYGKNDYEGLREKIRGSPYVHLDETGWRENGKNGYVWSAVTDDVRYFERHGTRSGKVPREMLGEDFCGVVVCDGYRGYDPLACQLQRCWVHLLRHGHEITVRHPDAAAAHAWVTGVRWIYDAAKTCVASPGYAELPEADRQAYALAFQQQIVSHIEPALNSTIKEQANLAKYLSAHVNELFVFVHYPEVPSENNPAERAIRPLVIMRKVSGGTRTEKGSKNKMLLASLLHTALLRGLAPVEIVEQMLQGNSIFASK